MSQIEGTTRSPRTASKARYNKSEKGRAAHRRWREENPERWSELKRASYFRTKYGLSPDEYAALLAQAGHRCEICGTPVTPAGATGERGTPQDRAQIDHDHATGKVRGVLCKACNTALGKMRDDPALLRRAAQYIEDHKEAEDADA